MKDLPPGHYPASEFSDSSDLADSPVVPQRRNEPGVRSAKPRRPWLAFFLGLCFQGLGHLYAGAPLRGAVALLLLMILLPSLTVVRAMLDFSRAGVLIGLALVFLAALVVPIDGALTARKRRYEPPARWNRVSIYALYAVVFTLLFPPALRWELDQSWFRTFKIVSGADGGHAAHRGLHHCRHAAEQAVSDPARRDRGLPPPETTWRNSTSSGSSDCPERR